MGVRSCASSKGCAPVTPSTATARGAMSSSRREIASLRPGTATPSGGTMTALRPILAIAVGLAALAAGRAAAQEATVHIGMARSVSNGAELIAIEKGYFKEVGIKVEIDDIDTSANTIALLATNRLQVIAGGHSAGYFT